jgi:hypothetical protein
VKLIFQVCIYASQLGTLLSASRYSSQVILLFYAITYDIRSSAPRDAAANKFGILRRPRMRSWADAISLRHNYFYSRQVVRFTTSTVRAFAHRSELHVLKPLVRLFCSNTFIHFPIPYILSCVYSICAEKTALSQLFHFRLHCIYST